MIAALRFGFDPEQLYRRMRCGSRWTILRRWVAVSSLAISQLCVVTTAALGWGDRTHPVIVRLAIETLPPEAAAYYGPHTRALMQRSVEPDSVMRAREGRAEAIRHFINLDALMSPPFAGFPRPYRAAVKRFGRAELERNGVLPWVILRFQRQLRDAIERGEKQRAVREAGYLAHYVADAYQPLHLTKNHDGQLSGALGLHRRFEDQLVDRHVERYARAAGHRMRHAEAVSDPRDAVFTAIFASYPAVGEIVQADRVAAEKNRRGSNAYYERLDAELSPLVARQLAGAASMIGSLWLTAWRAAKVGPPGPSLSLDDKQSGR